MWKRSSDGGLGWGSRMVLLVSDTSRRCCFDRCRRCSVWNPIEHPFCSLSSTWISSLDRLKRHMYWKKQVSQRAIDSYSTIAILVAESYTNAFAETSFAASQLASGQSHLVISTFRAVKLPGPILAACPVRALRWTAMWTCELRTIVSVLTKV